MVSSSRVLGGSILESWYPGLLLAAVTLPSVDAMVTTELFALVLLVVVFERFPKHLPAIMSNKSA